MSPENRKTFNYEWYTTTCLPEVYKYIKKTNKRRRAILHIGRNNSILDIELMGHFPYSPDLAPSDFFLFPTVKNKLRSQQFSTPEEAVCLKTMFWRYQNRNGKSATKIGLVI